MKITPRSLLFHSLLSITTLFLILASPVLGLEPDETLLLLEGGLAESVTASRAPKPLSQSAENITIVTAADIEAQHAHTLADVLATVPGVQLEAIRTPGSAAYLRLQGSNFSHVLVMLDSVPLNNLADNFSDIGLIPARIIERIEIVKGAASSAWGQALGGVINVITKSPEAAERPVGGSIDASYGERGTSDTGGDLGGALDRFGYYLSGGYLYSNGLLPNNHSRLSNAYAKLSYDLPGQGQVTATFATMQGKRGDFVYPALDMQEDSSPRITLVTLNLRQPLLERLEIELGGRYAEKKYNIDIKTIQEATLLQGVLLDESTAGLSARIIWRGTTNLLAAGVEYDDVRLRVNDSIMQVDTQNRQADRWGFYLNDTISLGAAAVSPGLRYDLTGSSGDQFSPSLGITWQLSENNLLRAYTARGYSLPPFLRELKSEKVWTSQLGFETSSIANLWVKGTLFRNDTWDIPTFDSVTREQKLERHIKQGGELELRTTPWHNTSLSGGYTYIDARRRSDHTGVKDVPPQTLQIGLRYDDLLYLQSLLTGRYIWWNATPNHLGKYSAMVWDLHLTATPFGRMTEAAEIFFSIRNLFNGSQYLDDAFHNTRRWAEMGVRYRF